MRLGCRDSEISGEMLWISEKKLKYGNEPLELDSDSFEPLAAEIHSMFIQL
jgi:hypothetical protein